MEPIIKLIYEQTYDLLNNAHAALVASGTAALETALFKVPQTVIYKVEGGFLLDFIMRDLVLKTANFSLPNIVMNKEIVVELYQKKMTIEKCKKRNEEVII